VHDMKTPVASLLHACFDAIIDGGTLDHIFNFPTAIRNCVEMVKIGGSVLIPSPANNHLGHGFYQFSPELFFRVLSEENGFKVERMILCERVDTNTWYEVLDPAALEARVDLAFSDHGILLLVHATRTDSAEIFARAPQQSDYQLAWEITDPALIGRGATEGRSPSNWAALAKRTIWALLPENSRGRIRSVRVSRKVTLSNQHRAFRLTKD
jgi:hypothetical protein